MLKTLVFKKHSEQYTQVAGLKKKEKQKGGSKRKKSWTEIFQKKKKNKGNKKNTSKPVQQEDGSHVPDHKHMNQFLVLSKFL